MMQTRATQQLFATRSDLMTNVESTTYRLVTVMLRLALVLGLFTAGWFVYVKLPHASDTSSKAVTTTNLEILLQPGSARTSLDIPVQMYPVDLVAVRHEYFAERRAGKRFEDFLKERMNGRAPVNAQLDAQGHATVLVSPGNWWVHALLPGDEDLEWRLPVTVTGQKQTIELTPQNAYTRAKSF
jgi:hypothetical protein